jgi:hypothetical protein
MTMIIVTPSEQDFLIGRKLDDNKWYQWEVSNVTTANKKDDNNRTNIVVTCVCLGPDDSQGSPVGVECTRYFPMDKLGFLTEFVTGAKIAEMAPGQKFNAAALQGSKFDGQNKLKEYQGKMGNNLANVAPFGTMTSNG